MGLRYLRSRRGKNFLVAAIGCVEFPLICERSRRVGRFDDVSGRHVSINAAGVLLF
jgi:hypothetical protein